MAHTKSAVKRHRQSLENNERNRAAKSAIITAGKKLATAVESGDAKVADEAFNNFSSVLDKAAKKGIIKANNASRRKSRAAAKVAKVKSA